MDTTTFLARIQREVALPDEVFAPLYRPLIDRIAATIAEPELPTVLRATLNVIRLRSAEVMPRGIAPEDSTQQADMWTYAVLVSCVRVSAGFAQDLMEAKRWIVNTVPRDALTWLNESVINSLLLHCQGRTTLTEPMLSLIARGFAREDAGLALPIVIDSIYARAEAGDIKHCRFGADLYFPQGCSVVTRTLFDELSFGAFGGCSDDVLLSVFSRCSIPAHTLRFSVPVDPPVVSSGICIERPSRLAPYPDLIVDKVALP